MPTRKLPQTDAERNAALRNAKTRKDFVPPPVIIPFMPATIIRLDMFQPVYKTKYNAVDAAKNAQTTLTASVNNARRLAIFNEQDFIDALNKAIRRELFLPSVRTLYKLDVNNANLPYIGSENDITTWGENINDGETARIAAGGVPITFPSKMDVNTAVGTFNTLNQQQANAKEGYDITQEALVTENPEADKLILKLWNEIETAFDEGNKPSMRRKAREWGVVYLPSPGEAVSPEEFSITGKIIDGVNLSPVSEVQVTVIENNTVVLSQPNGDYFIGTQAPGAYSLLVEKVNYHTLTIPPLTVALGAVTTRNFPIISVANPGLTVIVEGNLAVGEIATPDFSAVQPNGGSIVTIEITGCPVGIFATDSPAGVPSITHLDRPDSSVITFVVDDFKNLIGWAPGNDVIRVQNAGAVPGHFKFVFRNLQV